MKTNRHQPIPGSKPQNRPLPNGTSPLFRSYARQSVGHVGRPPSGEGSYEERPFRRSLMPLLLGGLFLGGLLLWGAPAVAQTSPPAPQQTPALKAPSGDLRADAPSPLVPSRPSRGEGAVAFNQPPGQALAADLPGGPAPAPTTAPAATTAADAPTAADAQALRLRQQAAAALIERTVVTLASGPAFDAKLTQHVRTPDHTAVGVGRYEQAGGNTGRVHMDMDISISKNQKCQLLQKCDGRLAWTREQVGDTVRLRRVDVGRLDEMVATQMSGISPRLRVGGLIELLERALADFELEQVPAELEGEPVWMLKGSLRPSSQAEILRQAEREDWPPLCPNAIAIAIAADNNKNGFGKGLPVRFEYWIDTESEEEAEDGQPVGNTRRLISYLKIYDLQPIQPAPETHFRLETGESDVNYTNDTQRYLDHFGIQVTEKQQRLLTR